MSKFGELPPDTYQVVKDLIEKDGKLIGYITGYSAFNDFALTTQVPAILEIGMRKEKKPLYVAFIVFDLSDKTIPSQKKIFRFCVYLIVSVFSKIFPIQRPTMLVNV